MTGRDRKTPARRFASLGLHAALLLALTAPAAATPTRIEVRVLSKGAKFVGTSMGGARVVVRDADTGEILARGVTAGGTGDTGRVMKQAQRHHDPVSDETAAVFRATLELDAPRQLEVEAFGPLGQRQSAGRATSTMWVVPGRHVTGGDGWLLELPGFVVDVLEPPAHQRRSGVRSVAVRANVTMMCGCPIEAGGLWDANAYEVRALVSRGGAPLGEIPLAYTGETSQFAGEVAVPEPGAYEIVVYAHDPATGNTGLDRTTVIVEPGS
jgi:hypothetical protein